MARRELINAPEAELVPAVLLSARGNEHARRLARADWVVRRKRDGRYLATLAGVRGEWRLRRLPADGDTGAPLRQAIAALGLSPPRRLPHGGAMTLRRRIPRRTSTPTLPLSDVRRALKTLGVDDGYAARTGLPLVAEPHRLAFAGRDRYRRALWLVRDAARAWQRMRAAAQRDGIALEAISGYRSHAYQLGIFARKRARGIALADILAVNAAPGYSEHHAGRALDISAPAEPPAEESFERTAAFAWLREHAGDHGFRLSYPRGNPHGIAYEPWHWYWIGRDGR